MDFNLVLVFLFQCFDTGKVIIHLLYIHAFGWLGILVRSVIRKAKYFDACLYGSLYIFFVCADGMAAAACMGMKVAFNHD